MDISDGGVEVLEIPCRNGVWHIEQCPPTSHIQCSALQKTTEHYYTMRKITRSTTINVHAHIYFGLSY